MYHCVFITAIKVNAVGVAGMSLGESVMGLPLFNLCVPVVLLRPSGLSYTHP